MPSAPHTTLSRSLDSTQYEQMEAEVERLRAQLAQSQNLAALGELLSTTTHELNNVLTTVINYAKMGARSQDSAIRDKSFQRILTAGERAAKITHSVLGMASNRQDHPAPVDLRPLVEETLVLLERELRKYRVDVEIDFNDVPRVLATGNQIQRVLINLIVNARQAMPQGGSLRIEIRHDVPSDMVELMVRDTGTGIAPDRLPRIFDPYYSTKSGPDASGKGGTGIGLSLCKEIIESHQGRIRVQSTVGVGTAFTLRFPAVDGTVD